MENEIFEEIKKKYKNSNKYVLNLTYEDIGILIHLVNEQSKEIEELKERDERANKRYLKSLQEKDDKCEKLLEYVETEKETDFISKDKIKAKIEEIKEEVKTCFIYGKSGRCTNNCKKACFYYDDIDILQRLLEKEE